MFKRVPSILFFEPWFLFCLFGAIFLGLCGVQWWYREDGVGWRWWLIGVPFGLAFAICSVCISDMQSKRMEGDHIQLLRMGMLGNFAMVIIGVLGSWYSPGAGLFKRENSHLRYTYWTAGQLYLDDKPYGIIDGNRSNFLDLCRYWLCDQVRWSIVNDPQSVECDITSISGDKTIYLAFRISPNKNRLDLYTLAIKKNLGYTYRDQSIANIKSTITKLLEEGGATNSASPANQTSPAEMATLDLGATIKEIRCIKDEYHFVDSAEITLTFSNGDFVIFR